MQIFKEYILLVPIVTWFASVFFKGLFLSLRKQFSFEAALGSGGMPSAHSALVTSVTTAIGIKYWVTSELFAACIVFSTIIIYDAINVRYEAGLHAKALNELTGKEYNFTESIGHLPQEAFVGSLLGIIVAFILVWL